MADHEPIAKYSANFVTRRLSLGPNSIPSDAASDARVTGESVSIGSWRFALFHEIGGSKNTFISAVALLLLASVGCRSRAHQDLYQAKLSNQIRVLEDQLYDADYQNRVLRDELERARGSETSVGPEYLESPSNSPLMPIPDQTFSEPAIRSTLPRVQTDPLDLDHRPKDPQPKLGDPFVDDPIADSQPRTLPSPPDLEEPAIPGAKTDSTQPLRDPLPKTNSGRRESIPAPKPDEELMPPAESELPMFQIEPGTLSPPKRATDSASRKIELPSSANLLQYRRPLIEDPPTPDRLELHKNLSGGHQFDEDDDVDGLYLVVTVLDENNQMLSLEQFDVDAEISIVVLDPEDESEDTRLGRWDFSPDEVRDFIRSTPVDGIHIPIAWQDRLPAGDEVIVHLRMAAAEEEMRCQAKLRLEQAVAISNWLPRG